MPNDELTEQSGQSHDKDATKVYDDKNGHYEGNVNGHRVTESEAKKTPPHATPFGLGGNPY